MTGSARLTSAALLAAGVMLCMAAVSPRPANANGVPTIVELSYIDLSNWGPVDASGSAELIFAEGIVRVEAQGLPRLTEQLYQGWLVNSEVGDAISFGRFNADAAGVIAYQGVLPPIANFGFDLVILTVEPDPDDAPQPSADRSIGGYFSLIGQADADGNLEGSQGGSLQAPGQLPNTGDPTLVTDLVRFGVLLAAMGLSVAVGLRMSRRVA